MSIHELKILPEYFNDIAKGTKKFEIRKADRDYRLGDTLVLQEWDHELKEYTGKELEVYVIYILGDESGYVLDGHVVMTIAGKEV